MSDISDVTRLICSTLRRVICVGLIDELQTRAEKYFSDGRARLIRSQEQHLRFSVRGSIANPYTVEIEPGTEIGSISARCSCPYNRKGYCKHIGASILEGLKYGHLRLLNTISMEDARRREVCIDIDHPTQHPTDTRNPAAVALCSEEKPHHADVAQETGSYRTVFVLVRNRGWVETHGDELVIKPMFQYVRKDGSPGRVIEYAPALERRSLSYAEQVLMSSLEEHQYKQGPLERYFPYLLKHSELHIKKLSGGRYDCCGFFQIEHANLHFTFADIDDREVPRFMPLVKFETEPLCPVRDDMLHTDGMRSVQAGAVIYFISEDSGSVFYVLCESPGIRQLQHVIGSGRSFDIADIDMMAASVDRAFLTVTTPKVKIHIQSIEPVLELLFTIHPEETFAEILYTYDGYSASGEERIIIGKRTESHIFLYRRNWRSEAALLSKLFSITGEETYADGELLLGRSFPAFMRACGFRLLSAGFKLSEKGLGSEICAAKRIEIIANTGIDWLDIKVHMDRKRVPFASIDLESGIVRHRKGFHVLTEADISRIGTLLEIGEQVGDHVRISTSDLWGIDEISDFTKSDDPRYARILASIEWLKRGIGASMADQPGSMSGMLRDYQRAGLSWLKFLHEFQFGGILADDMGLGKTVQAIALIAFLHQRNASGRYLVVAPVSTIANWVNEFARFLPSLTVYGHVGPKRPKKIGFVNGYQGAVVTSYHTLQRDIHLLKAITWEQLILDESQALKNPRTKNYAAVYQLTYRHVLALSGTPIENNIRELWSIMSILNPGLLYDESTFMRRFRGPISAGNVEMLDKLKLRIHPFILRRRKDDVAKELPEKDVIVVEVPLSASENRFYSLLKSRLGDEVKNALQSDEPWRAGILILTALTKLRQAVIAPILVGGPNRSSKIDLAVSKMEQAIANGHKVLLFSQFVRVLQMIQDRIVAKGWEHCYLDGSTSHKERQENVRRFQHDTNVRLFLISLRAGGVGINLTEADYVFLMDPWWNPAVQEQAVDRTHRIGQKRPVFAYKFISMGTIEEKILDLQEEKQELFSNVITADVSMFKALSKEQIISLFD